LWDKAGRPTATEQFGCCLRKYSPTVESKRHQVPADFVASQKTTPTRNSTAFLHGRKVSNTETEKYKVRIVHFGGAAGCS
jgi:hypothetical protein